MGGVGTDPNSMIPMALIFISGYVAMTRLPVALEAGSQTPLAESAASLARASHCSPRLPLPQPRRGRRATIGVVLLGAAPMAFAATNPVADPILNEALDGTPNATNVPAAPFNLVDQYGKAVSLTSSARQGSCDHLPRPGLYDRLPAHRPGVL